VALAQRMVGMAGLKPGMVVLEPSAGRGRIADAIMREDCVDLEMCEINPSNQGVLMAMGYELLTEDFFKHHPGYLYDAIIANPPFSKQQDVKHINRMLDMLEPGGRLVSVASASVLWRDNRLTVEFRERIASLGGRIEPLPEGTFREEGTMVNTCLVTVGC
jgi:phospholipid N-methyltransferase